MLVQVILGKVKDADLLMRQFERWIAEVKPTAKGYLGSTTGVTPDGRAISIARFESEAAARGNSDADKQSAWWNETAKAYDGQPTFYDCNEVDTLFGGGSNDARFVQVIQGKAKDAKGMRARMAEMEPELRKQRPDILGGAIAWHPDGSGFTQVMYFASEDETRRLEKETEGGATREEFMAMFAEPPVFYDLPSPLLD